jgi:serine/threonine-protein kinase
VILAATAGFLVWKRPPAPRATPSVAVLPFLSMSPDPNDEYFSDGTTEEIIHALAGVEGLRVISQTSTFAFKGKHPDLREVAAKLRVDHVVEGSVRKSGDTLRITAQLIRVDNDAHLWSATYDRPMKDVFAVQGEIAQNVVRTLRVKLAASGKPLRNRYTENLEAYNLYLKGRYFWDKWRPETTWKALDYFQQAVAKDPNYAPAYVGIAYSYRRLLSFEGAGGVPLPDGNDRSRAAAEKALQIDPLLAEAHAVLAINNSRRGARAEAERNFQRAFEIDPNDVLVHRWYAVALSAWGRTEEAIPEARRSLDLDPLSPDSHSVLADVLFLARRYDEAIASCRSALELDPNFIRAHFELGRIYAAQGNYDEAIKELLISERALGREERSPILGYVYGRAGRKAEARQILGRALERVPNRSMPPTGVAWIYIGLGEKERALDWLELDNYFYTANPEYDTLRSDPRFAALVQKLTGQPSH